MAKDIFCDLYGSWKQAGKIIFENDHAYSLLSVTPATPGHAVVVSKVHAERIEQLRGASLEGFIDAFGDTAVAVQKIYAEDPGRIVEFYRSLKEAPPLPGVDAMAEKMLQHRHLRVIPDSSYNIGINVGGYAGQSVNHLHAQLFPRREKGFGVVTAMSLLLES